MKIYRQLFVFFALGILSGCGGISGPPVAPVSGQLTLYGKPYSNGIITFTPVDGGPGAMSRADADGKYELWTNGRRGAVIGKHKVSVTSFIEQAATTNMSDVKSDDPRYAEMIANPDPYKKSAAKKEPVPAKYNTNTELSFDVNSGSNIIDLQLK